GRRPRPRACNGFRGPRGVQDGCRGAGLSGRGSRSRPLRVDHRGASPVNPDRSRIPEFYKLSIEERVRAVHERGLLSAADFRALSTGRHTLDIAAADKMIENVVGVMGLPLGLGMNLVVNGKQYIVPMVVEEPSVVAALGSACKLVGACGGFAAEASDPILIGQIQVVDLPDMAKARAKLLERKQEILNLANSFHPNMVARGGGARDIELYQHPLPSSGKPMLVVHLLVDTRDAMGANLVNGMCEGVAPLVESITGGRVFLRILSNLTDRSVVQVSCRIPVEKLAGRGYTGEQARDGIIVAADFAAVDPYRAATHNKGIMNGIDAVAIATGNDWRAIEAGAHAFAARTGAYRSLTTWTVDSDGNLAGRLELPLKVGVVGASIQANPAVAVSLELAGTTASAELAGLMAAVGLAQNFAALRALVTTGIQEGHMRLHARSVAASAGTPPEHFEAVVDRLVQSGEIKVRKAAELLSAVSAGGKSAARESGRAPEVHGRAAGKVIMMGEHAAVFGRQAVALPLVSAVTASVRECGDRTTLEFLDDDQPLAQPPAGLGELADLVMGRLGLAGRHFQVRVQSSVPRASGLGSSAAIAVAVIRAFNHVFALGLSDEAVNDLAYACEKLAHGNPSGIDNTVATYGEAVLYCKESAQPI